MSAPRKPGSHVTWETIEKVADQGERTRLEALSEADIDSELREAGLEPEEAMRVVKRAVEQAGEKRAPAPTTDPPRLANVQAVKPKTPWRPGTIAATTAVALAAGVLLVLSTRRPEGDAHGRPADAASPPERAAELRDEAYAGCAEHAWARCEGKLDEARRLDPAGETNPRVIAARKAVREAVGRDASR
jgi:hypothetical protein